MNNWMKSILWFFGEGNAGPLVCKLVQVVAVGAAFIMVAAQIRAGL